MRQTTALLFRYTPRPADHNTVLDIFELFLQLLFLFFLIQNGGVVQSYVDGCCRTCEFYTFYLWFAFGVALSGQSEVGVHHVAWQWGGLMAAWVVW